jgi:hypothetical protein
MIVQLFASVVLDTPGSARGPESRAEPKAGAKALRGQAGGTPGSATAVGGGLGTS